MEHDNPYGVGLTGLLGYGGAYGAIKNTLLLKLGTDFPCSEFLPGSRVRKVQVDQNPNTLASGLQWILGLFGDVKAAVRALLQSVSEKTDDRFLHE